MLVDEWSVGASGGRKRRGPPQGDERDKKKSLREQEIVQKREARERHWNLGGLQPSSSGRRGRLARSRSTSRNQHREVCISRLLEG